MEVDIASSQFLPARVDIRSYPFGLLLLMIDKSLFSPQKEELLSIFACPLAFWAVYLDSADLLYLFVVIVVVVIFVVVAVVVHPQCSFGIWFAVPEKRSQRRMKIRSW